MVGEVGGAGWVGLNLNPKLSTLHKIRLSKKFYTILLLQVFIHMIALS